MSFTSVQFLKFFPLVAVFTFMLSFPPDSFATTSVNLHVGATVLPVVNFNTTQHVTNYQVQYEDLRKGYIDLPNSVTVNLKTNVKGRVTVNLDNRGSGRILIKESGTVVFTENLFIVNTTGFRTGEPVIKNYDLRIVLPSDTQEGIKSLDFLMTMSI